MYALAGHVAEVLGKDSWESLTRHLILDPLGMSSTTFVRDKPYITKNNQSFAQPYVYDSPDLIKVESEYLQ